jgi:fatty acyl-CoA reductase
VILERLLLDFPETTVTVLVRSQTSATAVERVHYLTRKPAFDVIRQRLGGDHELLALLDERVTVIDGDFTRGEPELPSGIDVAIHSAATVSFDPPIQEAFQTNLLGAQNLYRAVATNNTPHLVHISTAYVAGVQKGVIPGAPRAQSGLPPGGRDGDAGEGRGRGRVAQARDARALHGEGRQGPLARRTEQESTA